MLNAILGFLGGPVASIIDKLVPDKEAAEKLKAELRRAAIEKSHELNMAAAGIVKAEAQSEHKLTAQWRPILMLSITAILINNYLVAPYAMAIFGVSVTLELPGPLWDLLTVGVGGYVVGRSVEKSVRHWPQGG